MAPDSHFSCILRMPFCPSSLVFPPSQTALSLADSKISSGLISARGMLSFDINRPYSTLGCQPCYLPSSSPRQYALALHVTFVLISASYNPQTLRKFPKLSFPPFSIRSISYGVQSSKLMLLILFTHENSRKAAAQSKQRKIAWLSSAHCLLARPQFKQRVLASTWKSRSNLCAVVNCAPSMKILQTCLIATNQYDLQKKIDLFVRKCGYYFPTSNL